ncbi:hypothetical protein F5Y08DRAFT_348259 [Xylaria arbuscula]|uniref:Uncharacterized protein n=1 Tax=Xylaria arbuscula TaxID=114810 RepID=A0A9W8TQ00_9PEZI|nr:hypothetical protein F5Y08DRAFT_348259 [Xylaria arbuscula]KAJ3579532.1 hypothetical protein NPX13_g1038 [Xylaria arbuscula]
MTGFLVSPNYVAPKSTQDDIVVASTVWGFSLAVALFTASKAIKQTWRSWRRVSRPTGYIIMVWGEWISSLIIGVISWLFLYGIIGPSFQFFFTVIVFWVFQTQCIMQILVNRIALITRDQRKITKLRWTVAGLLFLLNISVFVIWIPARLQVSSTFIHINDVWDRIEKALFAVIDLSLSSYFAYLVREKLISNGLTKYNRLFRYNILMIAFSLALDIVLIIVVPLGNGLVYLVFHPLVYLLKLHIELNLTDLLAKIVRVAEGHSTHSDNSKGRTGKSGTGAHVGGTRMATLITVNRDRPELDDNAKGIQKTVETEIRYTKDESDAASGTGSTNQLFEGSPY